MEVINLGYREVMLDSFYFIELCSGILVKIVILYYFDFFILLDIWNFICILLDIICTMYNKILFNTLYIFLIKLKKKTSIYFNII
jgi:hypothetical protein